jgi:hypothetical protein
MWAKLQRCFDYAEVELSNNLAENSMRPVALGIKNWLHVGSVLSGTSSLVSSQSISPSRFGAAFRKVRTQATRGKDVSATG